MVEAEDWGELAAGEWFFPSTLPVDVEKIVPTPTQLSRLSQNWMDEGTWYYIRSPKPVHSVEEKLYWRLLPIIIVEMADEELIKRLAEFVGNQYRYVTATGRYAYQKGGERLVDLIEKGRENFDGKWRGWVDLILEVRTFYVPEYPEPPKYFSMYEPEKIREWHRRRVEITVKIPLIKKIEPEEEEAIVMLRRTGLFLREISELMEYSISTVWRAIEKADYTG